MEKEDEGKIQDDGKRIDRSEPGAFESEFDRERRRVSYNGKFVEHYKENLFFISGILDMIYQLADAERLEDLERVGLASVVLDARIRVDELQENL